MFKSIQPSALNTHQVLFGKDHGSPGSLEICFGGWEGEVTHGTEGLVHLELYITHLTKPIGEGQEMAHHSSC